MDQSGGRGWQNKSKNIDRDDKTGKIVNSKRKIERIKAGEGVAEQTIKAKLTSGVNISLFIKTPTLAFCYILPTSTNIDKSKL